MWGNCDHLYKTGRPRGKEPCTLLKSFAHEITAEMKILDLGAGDGRNSIFLGQQGASVTAVDIAETGLQSINTEAKALNLQIQTVHQDILSFLQSTQESYDIIIAQHSLHFLDKESFKQALLLMQKKATASGLHLISCFLAEDEQELARVQNAGYHRPLPGELTDTYNDRKSLHYDESRGDRHEHNDGTGRHRHYIVKLATKKNQ